ncbi:tetratricopeptide repeat protein [Ruegeria lacuscaerulensis]|uniref:tetratricopeptide repeat protein n=1 Tax=Ruegeria lacuscaerulensis TaxID=55218 RepID=UPI00147FEFCE|nr:tetratricopeptide repeat protein [Ruegeria lacuscaerulensis]
MRIRLAALIIVIATLLLSFNSVSKPTTNYTELASSCLGNKGGMSNVVVACTTLMKAEEITPASEARLLRARGWAYYCGEQYDRAVSDYTSALALHPNDPHSILRRAFAHDLSGNVQAAEGDYAKALLLDSNSTYALYNKAKFDWRQEKIPAAIQGLERVLEIDPGYDGAGLVLADAHYDLDGVDGADQFLQQAKRRWPDQKWVYDAQMNLTLMYTGDHESALQASSVYARLSPGIINELFIPAMIHLKIGDEDKGIDYVSEYADRSVQQGLEDLRFYKRWYRKTTNWWVLGQDEEWLYRFMSYAMLGRTDLAKAEIDDFLRDAGENGRKIVVSVIRRAGVPVSQEAQAGSSGPLNDAIADYVDHLAKTSGFREFGPPKEG